MNWIIFALLLWVSMGLDLGLRGLLQLGDSAIAPRFGVVLLVFICLWARPGALMLGAVFVGLGMDIFTDVYITGQEGAITVLGPYALGCMLAGYTIFTVRSVMQRKSAFTLAALTLLATLLVEVVRITLLTVRSFYDDLALDGAVAALGTGAGTAVYTGLLALLLAPLLNALRKPMRFQGQSGMGFVIQG